MNTTQLKKEHPEVYREFFNKYDLVVSCPIIDSVTRTNLTSPKDVSASVIEKFPLRNYIGLSRDKGRGPAPLIQKANSETPFAVDSIEGTYHIGNEFASTAGIKTGYGCLSEYGWVDHPSVFGCLIAISMIQNGEISPEGLADSFRIGSREQDLLLKRIQKEGERWHGAGHISNSWGGMFIPHSSMFASNSHIFSHDSVNALELKNHGQGAQFSRANISTYAIRQNRFSKSFFRNSDIFDLQARISAVGKSLGCDQRFTGLAAAIEKTDFACGLLAYDIIHELYSEKSPTQDQFALLGACTTMGSGLFLRKDPDDAGVDLRFSLFCDGLRKKKDAYCCVCNEGDVYVVIGTKNFTITNGDIAAFNAGNGTNFTLDYSSHEDGWETEGVKLEQWRSKGIYSEFTSPYAVTVAVNGLRTESPAEYEEALAANAGGVVLDLEEKRIFVGGKPVTSKELKSQAATIDLLERLTKSDRGEISSKDLPASAYSKDRSEMSSKILSPLRRIVEKRLGMDFPIETRGSSDGGFMIRLEKCDVAIAAVRKR